MSKQELIRHNKRADVDYVVIEMKRSIMREWSKEAQNKYKGKHDWVGKIHQKQCKKFKSDHKNKRYMQNLLFVLEKETHKIFFGYGIQTDHLISTRRSDVVIVHKKWTYRIVEFAVPADHRVKQKESINSFKYLDLARELKKKLNMNVKMITIANDAHGTVSKNFGTRPGWLGNKGTRVDHPSYSIVEIGQNTEEIPGDLRRLSITRTGGKTIS